MLRRGSTATSLSVPSPQSTDSCMYQAYDVLRSQGLYLYDLREMFPRLEQITIGRRCLAGASGPASHFKRGECCAAFEVEKYFKSLLSHVKVCSSLSSAHCARLQGQEKENTCFVVLHTLGRSNQPSLERLKLTGEMAHCM